MNPDFRINVVPGFCASDDAAREWDRLLADCYADTIFLTSGWLRAWAKTKSHGARIFTVELRQDTALAAAGAFIESKGVVEFLGKGPSDYADVLISRRLDEATAKRALEALLSGARQATPNFRSFRLARIPEESKTIAYLASTDSGFYTTITKTMLAPTMDMTAADKALRKQSLKRHEKGLEKAGSVVVETRRRAADILPELDLYFEQHVRRWDGTPSPSLFNENENREFYRELARNLDQSATLRFTTIRLDGRLVAAHFGFYYADRFTWYKPSFEPELRKLSPGEVLIKKLIEYALTDHAAEFDFTIGDEAFKFRFSTRTRNVINVTIVQAPLKAALRRLQMRLARWKAALAGRAADGAALPLPRRERVKSKGTGVDTPPADTDDGSAKD